MHFSETEHKNLEYVGEINEHALCPNPEANALKKNIEL